MPLGQLRARAAWIWMAGCCVVMLWIGVASGVLCAGDDSDLPHWTPYPVKRAWRLVKALKVISWDERGIPILTAASGSLVFLGRSIAGYPTHPYEDCARMKVQQVMDSPSKVLHAIASARDRRAIMPKCLSFDERRA